MPTSFINVAPASVLVLRRDSETQEAVTFASTFSSSSSETSTSSRPSRAQAQLQYDQLEEPDLNLHPDPAARSLSLKDAQRRHFHITRQQSQHPGKFDTKLLFLFRDAASASDDHGEPVSLSLSASSR